MSEEQAAYGNPKEAQDIEARLKKIRAGGETLSKFPASHLGSLNPEYLAGYILEVNLMAETISEWRSALKIFEAFNDQNNWRLAGDGTEKDPFTVVWLGPGPAFIDMQMEALIHSRISLYGNAHHRGKRQ